MTKKLTICVGLMVLCIGLVGCETRFGNLPPKKIPEHLKLKVVKEKIITSKNINDKTKQYLYKTENEIQIDEDEDISKRTKNAKFYRKETREDGTKEWEAKIYPGNPFYKDKDKWYQTETATTTIKEFEKQTKITLLDKIKKILGHEVLADDAPFYSGSGDGHVETSCAIGSWNTCHDDPTGNSHDDITNDADVNSNITSVIWLKRAFFPIDTSDLPDGATISGATLAIYAEDSGDSGSRNYGIVQTTQPSISALENVDFDLCGSINNPDEGATRIAITSTGTKTFTLNATGITWISDTGYTKLGIRSSRDIDDSAPIDGSQEDDTTISTSEYTGTDRDPLLTVTYTEGGETPTDHKHIQQPIIFY